MSQKGAAPVAHTVKKSACNARDLASIPVLGRSPGEGHGHPPLYPCLENSMDRRARWARVHGVAKNRPLDKNDPNRNKHTRSPFHRRERQKDKQKQ